MPPSFGLGYEPPTWPEVCEAESIVDADWPTFWELTYDDYAREHLFEPLGIEFSWKRTPKGLADAEGGLYLTPRDLAKIGLLYMRDGVWNGKQRTVHTTRLCAEQDSVQSGQAPQVSVTVPSRTSSRRVTRSPSASARSWVTTSKVPS